MAYNFDLEAATDQIVTLETAIATPSPGITTVYAFNSTPSEITDPQLLPAIIHVNRGPLTAFDGGAIPGQITTATWNIAYDIESILLVIEAKAGKFAPDEAASNLFWKPILETFMNRTNSIALARAANAHTYACILGSPSYGLQSWPPVDPPVRMYWAYTYTHRFYFAGG